MYDSFGNIVTETDAANGDRFKYAEMEWDGATGQYYDRARDYDSVTGRFMGIDPDGFAAGDANLYGYVANDAPNATDHTGMLANPTPMPQAAQKRMLSRKDAAVVLAEAMQKMEQQQKYMSARQKIAYQKLKELYDKQLINIVPAGIYKTITVIGGKANQNRTPLQILIPQDVVSTANKLLIKLAHEAWHAMIDSSLNSVAEEVDAIRYECEWYAMMARNGLYQDLHYQDVIHGWDLGDIASQVRAAFPKGIPEVNDEYQANRESIGGPPPGPKTLSTKPNSPSDKGN